MLLPIIVILSLFGAAKVTVSHIDHEPKKEWKAMTEDEKDVWLKQYQVQSEFYRQQTENEFDRIPIQK